MTASVCIVFGPAECCWVDLDAATTFLAGRAFDTIAVKRAVELYPGKLFAYATLHPNAAVASIRSRDAMGFPMGFPLFTSTEFLRAAARMKRNGRELGISGVRLFSDLAGSSGLFGVRCALESHKKIILCGVPMDESPYSMTPNIPGLSMGNFQSHVNAYRRGWVKSHALLKDQVRSMSGWTREMLGAPTEEWLADAIHEM